MQSIQNLGLALIAMVAGTILDTRGYLILEVFFCICVCSEFSCVCFVLLLLGLDHNRFSVSVALMAVVALYFVDYLRGKRATTSLTHSFSFLIFLLIPPCLSPATGGDLNRSASSRANLLKEATE